MMSTDSAAGRLAGRVAATAVLLPFVWVGLIGSAECFPSRQRPLQPGVATDVREPAKAPGTETRTLERDDPALREAIASARASRSCSTLTQLGVRYYELELPEVAGRYLSEAIAMDPKCAPAHDALAKVWRQSGQHGQALGSAHRATYFSPLTAAFWNTYGTVLQEVGRADEAAAAYRRVVQLDASAAYAHSNLCYLATQAGDDDAAVAACLAALAVDPGFVPALNNLALLRAASGKSAEAFELFASAGGVPAAHYNMGMVRLSQRDYAAALTAFEAAYREHPAFDDAHAKARLVRRLLKQQSEKHSADDRRR
jgi:Tfp pilus assembly protein PilF